MKAKILRYYAALLTGALAFTAAAAAQWIWTQRPIQDVIFIAMMAYCIGIGAVLIATEPKRPQRRKHRAKPIDSRRNAGPVYITLDRRTWNNGKRL